MNEKTKRSHGRSSSALCGAVLGLSAGFAAAQDAAPAGPTALPASEPNPYYIGVSQALTHESNVFRTPNGPSDNYSTTSLLGGFDQAIGRQRIFANATVGANRYQDHTELNHTSYSLAGGLDWQTVGDVSGSLTASSARNLAYPAASGILPAQVRNESQREAVDATVRWGRGALSVEGGVGWSNLDYTDPRYITSESTGKTARLGVNYRTAGPLRLGVAVRGTRSDTPKALELTPNSGVFESNQARGKNLDFVFGYDVSGFVTTNGRISYTRVTNSNPRFSGADFSGLTGNVSAVYQATGRTSLVLSAARDAGVNSSAFNGTTVEMIGLTPVLRQETGLYQNNQVTNTIELAARYQATGKITLSPGVRYTRAKLLTTFLTAASTVVSPDSTDVAKTVFIGANWAASYNWSVACNAAHESRDVSGGVNYSVSANTIGCLAQYTWR